jgi:hypothetical protein
MANGVIVSVVAGLAVGIGFVVLFSIMSPPRPLLIDAGDIVNDVVYDKKDLYEMHDVIVDATINSFSNENGTPYVTMQVHEYFKNPQDRSQLLVKGEFGLTGDFCAIPDNCYRILAYMYQDENGNLSSGETWAWATKECDAKCMLGV